MELCASGLRVLYQFTQKWQSWITWSLYFLVFEKPMLIFIVAIPTYPLTNYEYRMILLTPSPTFVFLMLANLSGVSWILKVANCNSSDTYLFSSSVHLLGKCFGLLVFALHSWLYILDIDSLPNVWLAKMFFIL